MPHVLQALTTPFPRLEVFFGWCLPPKHLRWFPCCDGKVEDLRGEWGRINETDGPFWPFWIRFASISVESTYVFLRKLNPWLSFWSCIILYHLGTCCPRWHSRISNPRNPKNYQQRQFPNGVSANNTPTVIHHASLINIVHIYHNLLYL